jgi:hypothetical protein
MSTADDATGTVEAVTPEPPSTGIAALHELRRTRQRHRLGDLEWFDAAYRVYIVALFGGGTVLWLSSLVGDEPLSPADAAEALRHGPAVLGLVAVLATVMGLRSGSQGGPLALEGADVVHVMLAPLDRAAALRRPAVQRIRGAVFLGAAVGAILGQLAGRRLPGTELAWFGSGMLFGGTVALLWAGGAFVAHALRLPRAATTVIGAALLGWQVAAIAYHVPGPATLVGSLAFWGERQRPEDALAMLAAAGLVAAGFALLGRTSLDALSRRSTLVAQLRFAVTMQDLRTVILLRRQLTHEHTRPHPWFRLPRGGTSHPVWRRGWHSLLRLPVSRLVRMLALAAGIGACQAAAFRGTTPAILGSTALLFVLGLEVLEPLSQEIDQPDRHESFPVDRGWLLLHHLAAPAVALLPFAVVGGIVAVLFDDVRGGIATVAILSYPVVLTGLASGAVSIVRDAPDPMTDTNQQVFMPPEMAGLSQAVRTILPLLVSAAGAASVLFLRDAAQNDPSTVLSTAVRVAIGLLLLVAFVAAWVRFRDRAHRWWRSFMSEGRTYTQQQRAQAPTHRSTP